MLCSVCREKLGGKKMKLATRINSFLPIYGNDLTNVFGAFDELGIEYVDLNYPEHVKDIDAVSMKETLSENHLKLNGVALRFRN